MSLYVLMGAALRWGKIEFSRHLRWDGYDLDLDRRMTFPSPKKLKGIAEAIQKVPCPTRGLNVTTLQKALGKMAWASVVLRHANIFLQRSFASARATFSCRRNPWLI